MFNSGSKNNDPRADLGAARKALPASCEVVVIGGGVVGCSIAYHLALRGMRPLLLDRRRLASGSSWHSISLATQLRPTLDQTQLAQYSTKLYKTLEQETGVKTGFRQVGTVTIARSEERLTEQRRMLAMAKLFGLDGEELTPQKVQAHYPMLSLNGIIGGLWLPSDGVVSSTDLAQSFAAGARANGATIVENCKVQALIRERGRVLGVMTEQGEVAAGTVVLATGIWSRDFAALDGVTVPVQAVERFFAITAPMFGLPADLPVLRDPDENLFIYPKPDTASLMVSGFQPQSKPWHIDGIPENFCFPSLPPDITQIQPVMERAAVRVPALRNTPIDNYFTAPEAFSPDGNAVIGPAPEVQGLFVAAGFGLTGVQSAGGAGKIVADWIADGHPGLDVASTDIGRFLPFQANRDYLAERVSEMPAALYALHWPYAERTTARNVRRSILHDRLAARGARFSELNGWEVPNWYQRPGNRVAPALPSFERPGWFAAVGEEHRAVREAVALIDRSNMGKYRVQGPGALALLNTISSADIDVPPGRVVYTHWLNVHGGIEASVFVGRLGEQDFLIFTDAATQGRDYNLLRQAAGRYLPSGVNARQCGIVDVTSGYAMLGLFGPRARALLAKISPTDVSDTQFRRMDLRELEIGCARVTAARASFLGEQGFDLLIPTEFAPDVFDRIIAAGDGFGLQMFGRYAEDSLRLEKAFPAWGRDVLSDLTPLEAGSELAVAMDKPGGFLGREALARQLAERPKRHLVQFLLADPAADVFGGEPIWHDGMRVGHVTSAAFGYTLGAAVALGVVRGQPRHGEAYQIEVSDGRRLPAKAALVPLYDPDEERLAA